MTYISANYFTGKRTKVALLSSMTIVLINCVFICQPMSVDFKLVGDKQACNGSDVVIKALKLDHSSSVPNISWNITWNSDGIEGQRLTQSEVMAAWDSIRRVRNASTTTVNKAGVAKFSVPGELVSFRVNCCILLHSNN